MNHFKSTFIKAIAVFNAMFLVACLDAEPPIEIRADEEEIVVMLRTATPGAYSLVINSVGDVFPKALPKATSTVYQFPDDGVLRLYRMDDEGRDRIFQRFQVYDERSGLPYKSYAYVTSIEPSPTATVAFDPTRRLKGLTIIQSLEDAKELGVERTGINILLNALIDLDPTIGTPFIKVDGVKVYYKSAYLESLDREIKRYTDHGIEVTAVLLNHLGAKDQRSHNLLVNPDTDIDQSPLGYAAFNTRTEGGLRAFRAAVTLLIDRYTRGDQKYGTLSGMVIGNEVNIHWVWHNQGETSDEVVIRDYEIALRYAWIVAQTIHSEFKIYLSAEHNWNQRGFKGDASKEMGAMTLLQGLNDLVKAHGNFGWNVAYHPYPEDLTEAAFWKDRKAQFYLDTRVISFRNLEVLIAFLKQDDFLYKGKLRSVALTEQGFHAKDAEEGELIQAAALAYFFKKLELIPEVETFLLHRHVDHPNEGGLRLGIRSFDADAPGQLGGARKAWHVFKAFQTEAEVDEFEFALEVVGYNAWSDIPVEPAVGASVPVGEEPVGSVFDFVRSIDLAKVEDAIVFREDETIVSGGWLASAIFHHPPASGSSIASWQVRLPELKEGESLQFKFGTALKTDSSPDGVLYRVRVEGELLFEHDQLKRENLGHRVDLSEFSGQTIQLDLEVDPKQSVDYDWSLWVAPKIVIVPTVEY